MIITATKASRRHEGKKHHYFLICAHLRNLWMGMNPQMTPMTQIEKASKQRHDHHRNESIKKT
jgi:hypothetical protein